MTMNKKQMEAICKRGELADTWLMKGETRAALKELKAIVAELESSGDLDSYLAARITLSVLRCHVKLADFKAACDIWNSKLEESLYGVGIYSLERAQTIVRDLIAYDMICAFLHTLVDQEKSAAAASVNQYLSRVCEHATEHGDRGTMRLALNNWKQHLREIFNGTIPHAAAQPLIHFEKSFEESVKPQPIEFPPPSAWEKPSDFREMSRVADVKPTKPKAS